MVIEAIDAVLLEQRRTRRERSTLRYERELRARLREAFSAQQRLLLEDFIAGMTVDELNRLWETVAAGTFTDMSLAAQTGANGAYQTGILAQSVDIGIDIDFTLEHPRAVAFLENRGAELITQINETTRRETNRILTNGLRNGESYTEIAEQLRRKFEDYRIPKPQQHIRDRAELIAVQEMGDAYEQGSLDTARELRSLGVSVEKSLLTVGDDRLDDLCRADAAAGWIPLETPYPSGRQRPPIHVACRCTNLVRRQRPDAN